MVYYLKYSGQQIGVHWLNTTVNVASGFVFLETSVTHLFCNSGIRYVRSWTDTSKERKVVEQVIGLERVKILFAVMFLASEKD